MGEGRALRVSGRVYRVLLLAYPEDFRQEYGPHMVQTFEDLCREELGKSRATGLIGLWVRMLLDLATAAFVERSRATRRGLSYLGERNLTLGKLMLVNAAILLLCGLALTNAPVVIELYGFAPPPIGSPNPADWVSMAFARFFGVTCLAFGLLLWAVSRVAETEARRAVSGVLFLANLFGVLLLLGQQTQIWLSVVGWITVLVHLLFAIGYGLFWFKSFDTLAPLPPDGGATASSFRRDGKSGKTSSTTRTYHLSTGSPAGGGERDRDPN